MHSSPYNLWKKKIQMCRYLFYDYHLVYILATVWDTSTSISNFVVFLNTIFDSLKQSRLDFSNPKQTLFKSNYFKSTSYSLSFQISFVSNKSKALALPSYTIVNWKHKDGNLLWSIWRILSLWTLFFCYSFLKWRCCRDFLR